MPFIKYPLRQDWGSFLLSALLLISCASSGDDATVKREAMVRSQIEDRGIRNPKVLSAMRKVERHRFVPLRLAGSAYEDGPLPIGLGQTISQPYIVALMTELIDPDSAMNSCETLPPMTPESAETARVCTPQRLKMLT